MATSWRVVSQRESRDVNVTESRKRSNPEIRISQFTLETSRHNYREFVSYACVKKKKKESFTGGGGKKKIGNTSQFTCVILAQGPC